MVFVPCPRVIGWIESALDDMEDATGAVVGGVSSAAAVLSSVAATAVKV